MIRRFVQRGVYPAGLLLLLAGCATQPAVDQEAVPEPAAPRVSASKKAPAAPVTTEKQAMAAVDVENSIFFPPNGVTVDLEGRRRLAEHAEHLKANPGKVVTLIGHTDDQGSPSYNLAIAEQRVNAVHAVLRSQGVPLVQIRRYGVGSEKNELVCKSAQCRQKMRRVQLVFE